MKEGGKYNTQLNRFLNVRFDVFMMVSVHVVIVFMLPSG
jgi:hypothetical protein